MRNTFVIAEIGINANGSIDIAKKLIKGAKESGSNAVKFQKRTIDVVYSKKELDTPRESPWGNTNRQQKEGLEFGENEYNEIDRYCKEVGIEWFASAWDTQSQLFLQQYDLKYNKIASAMLTDKFFVELVASEKKHTFVSTGMSNLQEVVDAVIIFEKNRCPYELLHTNSTYPMDNKDANLLVIKTFQDKFLNKEHPFCKGIGYSGHERGRIVSVAAVALGASTIERHITLDKTMYGSDQAASIEIDDFKRLIIDIRTIEEALGKPEKRVLETEIPIREKLRKK